MKYNHLIGIVLFLHFNNTVYSQPIYSTGKIENDCKRLTDTTLNYFTSLNLNLYTNKPIDSFLNIVPTNYIGMKVYGSHIAKYADVLAIKYSNKVTVYIYVKQYQFINPRSETFTWDITLFRKENVHHIEVWKAVDCYNGCPDGTPIVQ